MKQRAHAWVALRALKLIDDSGKVPKLVELLSYYLSDIWEGAWLPDTLIADMAYGHIFKMENDPKILGARAADSRARVAYKDLKPKMKGDRLCLEYIKNSEEMSKPCWSQEGHLPNRVIALSHTVGDMLKMSDYPIAFYAKNEKPKEYERDLTKEHIKDLSLSPNFSARQVALTFFMLGHYITDCHMPLHCDLRDFNSKIAARRLPEGLHPSIEEKWEEYFPEKEILILDGQEKISVSEIVIDNLPKDSAVKIDFNKAYYLNNDFSLIAGDEWLEMVNIARVSFVLSREWLNNPYKDADDLIKNKGKDEFDEVTNRIFHDAVQSVAMIWCKAWDRYIK